MVRLEEGGGGRIISEDKIEKAAYGRCVFTMR